MKKTFSRTKALINLSLITLSIVGVNQQSFAQTEETKGKEKEKKESGKIDATDKSTAAIKYRRSSLHTMIIEDAKLPKIDIILKTFNEAPFPDKYNNHTVGEKSFNLANYTVEQVVAEGEKAEKEDKDLSPAINKYFADSKTANKIIAKWFSRKDNGAFDMSLIEERGMYDASAQDIAVASSTARGDAMLADAGEELLPNTFVVVNYSKFVSNEPIALAIKNSTYALAASKPGAFKEIAEKAADVLYNKTKDGYSVWTTAYLYQINWNDSTSAVFYQNYWMDDSKIDPAKKEAFDNSDLFKLELLGFQKASILISGLGANAKDEDMIIKNATLKSIDAVYAKLQRKFEKFRTKTPLTGVDPLTAKIGLKEGVENGDKYEVLEQTIDELGKVKYKRKGVINVEKNKIWNNKFAPGEEPVDEEGNPIKLDYTLDFTTFKGGKGYYPGMLIRQIN
ncbi:MAG: hypothetical protein HYU68_10885 [Bacteroidetes bacterium]|nr:hypothetical protein [Bacteroidota bacterium]